MVLFVTWQLFAKSCSNVVLPFAMVHVVAVEVFGSEKFPEKWGKNAVSVQNSQKNMIFELFLEKMH